MKQQPSGWICVEHEVENQQSTCSAQDYSFPAFPVKRSAQTDAVAAGQHSVTPTKNEETGGDSDGGLISPRGRVLDVDLWLPPAAIAMHRFRSADVSGRTNRPASLHMKAHVELGEPLGKGATSVVYRGRIRETDEVVAVKQLTYKSVRQQDYRKIWDEMAMLKDLVHCNVVRYRGVQFNEHAREVHIVLECIPDTLQHRIARGPMSETEAAYIVRQVLRGLAHLHSKKVIHRDLKPANILLTESCVVKMTDFGASTRVVDVATMRRTCIGTPYYTAPEVIAVEPYSYPADIWSLGCCTVEMVTGNRPYHELNEMAAMFRIVEDDRPEIPTSVSHVCRDFLMLCWQKDPKMRPSASVLLQHAFLQLADRWMPVPSPNTAHTFPGRSVYQSVGASVGLHRPSFPSASPMPTLAAVLEQTPTRLVHSAASVSPAPTIVSPSVASVEAQIGRAS